MGPVRQMTGGGEAFTGEGKAFVERVFRKYNEDLVRFLRRRLRQEADALEASQETYIRLLRLDLELSDEPVHVKAYLFRIASNVATDMLRRRGREGRIFQSEMVDVGAEPDQHAALDAKQKLLIIDHAIRSLPHKQRQAFLLSRNEGWSSERIAAELQVTDRMVRIYLVRTLEHIQRAIAGASSEH